MIVLYINNEHCTSLEQLKGYFSENLTPESETYSDLLDYGRYGDLARWLREMDEVELASSVAAIDTSLGDSAFYAQMKAFITGVEPDPEPLKPSFNSCFSYDDIKCDVKGTKVKVSVSLKVLKSVNEEYVLSVSTNWGLRCMTVNPYSLPEGKSVNYEFTFNKRPDKNLGEITVMADGDELSRLSKFGRGDDEITVGDVTFKMIYVEGGTFVMASNYHVTLSSYSIGETQVTQALWQAVMGNNPSCFRGAENPVEDVSWDDCQTFIKKLNQETGRRFRLPTEAEWEFAARGGMKSQGYEYSGSNDINDVAWYDGNSGSTLHQVKQRMPNELGIYDMSGNVWEWCQDWYGNYKFGIHVNPTGPASGSTCVIRRGIRSVDKICFHVPTHDPCRVIRGGSWSDDDSHCRLSYRGSFFPDLSIGIGLRLALSE